MPGEKKIKIDDGDQAQGNRTADDAEPTRSPENDQNSTAKVDSIKVLQKTPMVLAVLCC